MKPVLFILCALMLTACNGPSRDMRGATMTEITVEGADFRVFISGNRAQAVRTNFEFPANVRTVFPRAIIAMETVSGCRIDPATVTGDAAMISAPLFCN